MRNWYFCFQKSISDEQIFGDIITPSIPDLNFAIVKEQLILPFLKSQRIEYPIGLTYARAKNAPINTEKVLACCIANSLHVNGVKYKLLKNNQMVMHKESHTKINNNMINSKLYLRNEISGIQDLKQLFSLWRELQVYDKEYSNNSHSMVSKKSFVEDGMVHPEEYYNAKIKVLFILKEANIIFDNQIESNGKYTAYRSSIEWINQVITMGSYHELIKTIEGMNNAIYEIAGQESCSLDKIAYMNLNKRGGGGKASLKVLKSYVSQYRSFIKREIEILNPDFVICCGAGCYELVSKIRVGHNVETSYFYDNDSLFIKGRHPSYHFMATEDKIKEFRDQFDFAYHNE